LRCCGIPHSVPTFSDSGAHVNSVINASLQTYLLSYWVRQRQALRMEEAIRKITFDIASFWRLKGRGLLREGYFADVVIFDPNILAPAVAKARNTTCRQAPSALCKRRSGSKKRLSTGQIFMRNGEHTGHCRPIDAGPLARQ